MASVAPAIELDLIRHGCCSDPTEINEEVPICGSDATKRECSTGQNAQALPSADGGRQAWSFLAACFLMEGVIWGTAPNMMPFGRFVRKGLMSLLQDCHSHSECSKRITVLTGHSSSRREA